MQEESIFSTLASKCNFKKVSWNRLNVKRSSVSRLVSSQHMLKAFEVSSSRIVGTFGGVLVSSSIFAVAASLNCWLCFNLSLFEDFPLSLQLAQLFTAFALGSSSTVLKLLLVEDGKSGLVHASRRNTGRIRLANG